MGRPTVLGVGSQMGAGKSATTYVSTIPSANQAANGKLKKSCCAPQTATGTTSLTSDNSGNDHQGTGNGVGGYLKKTFKKKLLKARNPRAADLQAYASSGDAQIHTHVNPLSPEASTLLQMIHGCDWALVREHLSTKKGAHEFHKALEYDETSQAMSLDLNTGASVTSESIDGSMHALREPEVISTFVPVPQPMKSRHLKKKHSGSEYVSPGTVSQSNFGAVKKVTATHSNKQQQSRPESADNAGPVANNDDSAHSGTVDEDLEDEDNFDDDSLLRTSTASVSSSLRVDNALRSSLQGSVVFNGAEGGGGGGGNSSVRSGGSGSKSSHKAGKIKTISCTPTLLHLLCTLNPPVQMVQRVLSQKPSFAQAMNNLEQTPLHLCCVYGASPQVIQCLLKHNKRLATLLDHRGRTPLHLLCEVGIRKEQEEIMSGRIGASRSGYDSSDNDDDDDLEEDEETPVKECMDFLLWAYPDAVLLVDSEKKIPLDYAVAAKAHPKWILQLQKIQNSRYELLNGKSNNKLHSDEEG